MKTPAILIMTVTLMVIGILILEFHLSNENRVNSIPDDYSELLASVQNQESKILLIGEDLPFPKSMNHQVVSSMNELSVHSLGQIDFIIVNTSNQFINPVFSTAQIDMLKLYNQQGASIIFIGLTSYDFLDINHDISSNYPYGIGIIKMNPNSFDQGNYEIYIPTTNNPELKLYNVLRMIVSR